MAKFSTGASLQGNVQAADTRRLVFHKQSGEKELVSSANEVELCFQTLWLTANNAGNNAVISLQGEKSVNTKLEGVNGNVGGFTLEEAQRKLAVIKSGEITTKEVV